MFFHDSEEDEEKAGGEGGSRTMNEEATDFGGISAVDEDDDNFRANDFVAYENDEYCAFNHFEDYDDVAEENDANGEMVFKTLKYLLKKLWLNIQT